MVIAVLPILAFYFFNLYGSACAVNEKKKKRERPFAFKFKLYNCDVVKALLC